MSKVPKSQLLQITVRIKDPAMKRFLEDKLLHFENKGIKNPSLQALIEGLILKWMEEDERQK